MANAPCAAPRLRPGLPWKGEQANPGLAGQSLSADGSPMFHRCVSPVGTGSRPVPAAAELPAAVFGVSELAARPLCPAEPSALSWGQRCRGAPWLVAPVAAGRWLMLLPWRPLARPGSQVPREGQPDFTFIFSAWILLALVLF